MLEHKAEVFGLVIVCSCAKNDPAWARLVAVTSGDDVIEGIDTARRDYILRDY